jgi:hypothetical protein
MMAVEAREAALAMGAIGHEVAVRMRQDWDDDRCRGVLKRA